VRVLPPSGITRGGGTNYSFVNALEGKKTKSLSQRDRQEKTPREKPKIIYLKDEGELTKTNITHPE